MEGFASFREFVHQMRAGKKAAGDRPLIDGMTEVQVRERAGLSREQLVARLADVGPRAARARGTRAGPVPADAAEAGHARWHQGDVAHGLPARRRSSPATRGCTASTSLARRVARIVLTPDHDGRIVADVVAEWARRHGQPFTLHLDRARPAATFTSGTGGEEITIDAVEFCRILSGRATGAGLLTQEVPF